MMVKKIVCQPSHSVLHAWRLLVRAGALLHGRVARSHHQAYQEVQVLQNENKRKGRLGSLGSRVL